ncbi:spore coat protein [Paenibacillus montanisoli]|uniref:Spore coat protein n=1 Tax=Paenibacillus montanisoli TaxID=2081970 RepID=A0A328U3F3_9BACL|nr:spore coat protein [Paenibacillus montanisoli]RAP77357.1 spore coat protein [Paenibacillus montanisoli]
MDQQQYQQGQARPILSDEDLAYTVLADLKRVVREYATAATEANCQQIRQLFTNLMNSTLQMQGNLYNLMLQHNMYDTSSPALRQEVDKQLKMNQQTAQKTQQFLQQQHLGGYASHQYQAPQQQLHQQQNPGVNPYFM